MTRKRSGKHRSSYRHLYKTKQWREGRLAFLTEHPICAHCQRRDRLTPATVVDHIKDHKGNETLFFEQDNWQPLCKPCHDSDKRIEDSRGYMPDIGADGFPIDPRHPACR